MNKMKNIKRYGQETFQNGDHIKARADVQRTISLLLLEKYPSLFSEGTRIISYETSLSLISPARETLVN